MLRPFEVRGILELVKQNVDELLDIAGNLTHTCYKMYTTTTSGMCVCLCWWRYECCGTAAGLCVYFCTGLAPEIVTFKRGQDFKPNLCVRCFLCGCL